MQEIFGGAGKGDRPSVVQRWAVGSLAVAGLSAVAAVAGLAAGCARLTPFAEAEHDHAAEHGDHPPHEHSDADDHDHAPVGKATSPAASFADALAKIVELDGTIRAACEANDPEAAHDEFHAIGHLLEQLPALAATAGVSLDSKTVVRSAEVLFDAFSRIDDKLHGGEGSTYTEEAETIGRELASFRAFLVEHRP